MNLFVPPVVRQSKTMFAIERHDAWNGYAYECRVCHAEGSTTATIAHDAECPVGSDPDAVSHPFPDSTVDVIQTVVRTAKHRLGDAEDTYVSDILDDLRAIDGVKWVSTGSTSRVALGLGRTSPRGALHLSDRRGVVLKLDPPVRWKETTTPTSGNIDELYTWETAVRTETTMLFADILAAASDGLWLAMEACIPIHLAIREEMTTSDALYDNGGEQYINPLRGALRHYGWKNPDYKHGNIGLTDAGTPVLLDYGTGPQYDPELAAKAQAEAADADEST